MMIVAGHADLDLKLQKKSHALQMGLYAFYLKFTHVVHSSYTIIWEHFKSKSELLKSSAIMCLFNKPLIYRVFKSVTVLLEYIKLCWNCPFASVNLHDYRNILLLYANIMFKIMSA